jgi:hypothetical protein
MTDRRANVRERIPVGAFMSNGLSRALVGNCVPTGSARNSYFIALTLSEGDK